jgi:hypothetical protein
VYALDLIGFGLSEKVGAGVGGAVNSPVMVRNNNATHVPQALIDYTNGKPWIAEISTFVRDIIGGGPVVLVVRAREPHHA